MWTGERQTEREREPEERFHRAESATIQYNIGIKLIFSLSFWETFISCNS